MARLGMCDISNLKLNKKSKRTVEDIKDILDNGKLLQGTLALTPFYYIFGTPSVTKSPFETYINIREHDWDRFISAMGGATQIVRNKVFMLANEREVFTYGEEQKFWACVSEATK